jgi:hypothetical protein
MLPTSSAHEEATALLEAYSNCQTMSFGVGRKVQQSTLKDGLATRPLQPDQNHKFDIPTKRSPWGLPLTSRKTACRLARNRNTNPPNSLGLMKACEVSGPLPPTPRRAHKLVPWRGTTLLSHPQNGRHSFVQILLHKYGA